MLVTLMSFLLTLGQPGQVGTSAFFCTEPEAVLEIIDMGFPKKVPDDVPCYFEFPHFGFVVIERIYQHDGFNVYKVLNLKEGGGIRYVMTPVEGEDA